MPNKEKERHKDFSAQKTITILKKFFGQKNLFVNIVEIQKSEAGTWFCHLTLEHKGKEVLYSNGKGVTKELCLASGLAELYERFCNKSQYLRLPFYNYFLSKNNFITKRYSLSEEEKKIKIEEMLKIPIFNSFFQRFFKDEENYKIGYDYITNGEHLGIPYSSLDNTKKIYIDPRILFRVNGTIGMAAGNTIEEALNQANAEIYEKYVGYSFFYDNFDKYYIYDLRKITNKINRQIIENIKKLGYKIYIVDLSYNYKMPVLMSVLIDKEKGSIYTNFGASLDFNVALERILTELYQGRITYKTNSDSIIPFKTKDKEEILYLQVERNVNNFFPEDFFNKLEYVDYNKNIFKENLKTNKEILQYFKELNNSLGYNFYYQENSQKNGIKSLQLVCSNLDIYSVAKKHLYKKYQDIDIKIVLNMLKIIHNILRSLIINNYNYVYFEKLFALMNKYRKEYFYLLELSWGCFDFFPSQEDIISSFYEKLFESYHYNSLFYDKVFFLEARQLFQLKEYLENKNYSLEEIIDFYKNVFEKKIDNNILNNISSIDFIINEAFFKPTRNYFFSYQNFIKIWEE